MHKTQLLPTTFLLGILWASLPPHAQAPHGPPPSLDFRPQIPVPRPLRPGVEAVRLPAQRSARPPSHP